MKQDAIAILSPDSPSPADRTFQPSGEASEIMINAMGTLTSIGGGLAAALFAEALVNTVPLFSPDGKDFFLSKISDIYSSHAERMARATLDSIETIFDAQRKLLAWEAEYISKISNTSTAQ